MSEAPLMRSFGGSKSLAAKHTEFKSLNTMPKGALQLF